MYYAQKSNLGKLVVAASRDPRLPFPPVEPGMEYTVAMPLWGPWYWGNPNLGPESYYNPRTYPYPADTGGYITRWSGSFIQPRNLDPVAYELMQGSLGDLDWHVEDPTGGAYSGGGDPIWGDPLGPGENIAVAMQWAGQLKPRGFATLTK